MSEGEALILAAVTAFLLAAGVTMMMLRAGERFLLDRPNPRSLHVRPIPRGGGIGIVVAIAVSAGTYWLLIGLPPPGLIVVGAGGVVLATASLIDDVLTLGAALRLAVHAGIAALLVGSGLRLPSEFWPGAFWALPDLGLAVLTGLYVVWMINLYNFMDGMDGFAGGMAVFGFGGLAMLGWFAQNVGFACTSAVVAASSAGFLVFNFPPARIFMGDVGSTTLGLLAAALSLWAARDGVAPLWGSLLLFSPFVVDATYTLIRRGLRRERVWEAHRTHIYQRLVQCGWGHRKTVLCEYLLMAVCVALAIWAIRRPVATQQYVILFSSVLYVSLIAAASAYEVWQKARSEHGQNSG